MISDLGYWISDIKKGNKRFIGEMDLEGHRVVAEAPLLVRCRAKRWQTKTRVARFLAGANAAPKQQHNTRHETIK